MGELIAVENELQNYTSKVNSLTFDDVITDFSTVLSDDYSTKLRHYFMNQVDKVKHKKGYKIDVPLTLATSVVPAIGFGLSGIGTAVVLNVALTYMLVNNRRRKDDDRNDRVQRSNYKHNKTFKQLSKLECEIIDGNIGFNDARIMYLDTIKQYPQSETDLLGKIEQFKMIYDKVMDSRITYSDLDVLDVWAQKFRGVVIESLEDLTSLNSKNDMYKNMHQNPETLAKKLKSIDSKKALELVKPKYASFLDECKNFKKKIETKNNSLDAFKIKFKKLSASLINSFKEKHTISYRGPDEYRREALEFALGLINPLSFEEINNPFNDLIRSQLSKQ